MRPDQVALVLLAAGRSRRFGDADKLAAPFQGKPLALHVVTALTAIPFAARFAVVSGTRVDFAAQGYAVLPNPDAAAGQAGSLRIGIAAARASGAAGVLVALADMPRVTAAHVCRLIDAAHDEAAVVASSDGVHPMPPALFGAAHYPALDALAGDQGARDLSRGGRHIVTSPAELVDIDTAADLAALRARYGVAGDGVR